MSASDAPEPAALEGKRFLIDEDRERARAVCRSAARHHPDDVEDLECLDGPQHQRHQQRAGEIGHDDRRETVERTGPSTSDAAVMSRGTAWSAASAISATSGKFFQQSATISAASAVPLAEPGSDSCRGGRAASARH